MRPVIGAALATRPSSCADQVDAAEGARVLVLDQREDGGLGERAGVHAVAEAGVGADVLGDGLGDRLDDGRLLAGRVEAEGDVDREADVVELVLLVVDQAVGDLAGEPARTGLDRLRVVRRRRARRAERQPGEHAVAAVAATKMDRGRDVPMTSFPLLQRGRTPAMSSVPVATRCVPRQRVFRTLRRGCSGSHTSYSRGTADAYGCGSAPELGPASPDNGRVLLCAPGRERAQCTPVGGAPPNRVRLA